MYQWDSINNYNSFAYSDSLFDCSLNNFKPCKNRLSEVNMAHTRYAYRYGRLGKFDCVVTRAILRDRVANEMAAPMHC